MSSHPWIGGAWACAALAVSPISPAGQLLSLGEYAKLLAWCHERTGRLVELLEQELQWLGWAQNAPPGAVDWIGLNQELAKIALAYDEIAGSAYVTERGIALWPLSGSLSLAGGSAGTGFAGWELPGQPCAQGLVQIGVWTAHEPVGPLGPTPDKLVWWIETREARLLRARIDRQLLEAQLLGLPQGQWSSLWTGNGVPNCPDQGFQLNNTAGREVVESMDKACAWLGSQVVEMRNLAVRAASEPGSSATLAALDERFQALDDSVEALATGFSVFQSHWLANAAPMAVEAVDPNSAPVWIPSFDLEPSTLGIDGMSILSVANASAGLPILDTALFSIAVSRRQISGLVDLLSARKR